MSFRYQMYQHALDEDRSGQIDDETERLQQARLASRYSVSWKAGVALSGAALVGVALVRARFAHSWLGRVCYRIVYLLLLRSRSLCFVCLGVEYRVLQQVWSRGCVTGNCEWWIVLAIGSWRIRPGFGTNIPLRKFQCRKIRSSNEEESIICGRYLHFREWDIF